MTPKKPNSTNPPLRIPTAARPSNDDRAPRYRLAHTTSRTSPAAFPPNPKGGNTGALSTVSEFLVAQLVPLEMAPRHTTSTSTRSPAYYDLHLDGSLILKRVIFVDDLSTRLASLCDGMAPLGLRKNKNPGSCPFILEEDRVRATLDRPILKEHGLTQIYAARTGKICSPIAAAIILEDEAWPEDFLKWVTETEDTRAIADGFLVADPSEETLHVLPSAFKRDVKALGDHHLKRIAVWEFKSLKAAPDLFMEGFHTEIEGSFPWISCENTVAVGDRIYSHSCGTGESTGHSHVSQMGRVTVSGRKTGPDSGIIARQFWQESVDNENQGRKQLDPDEFKRKRTALDTVDVPSTASRHASTQKHPRSFHHCRPAEFWTQDNLKRVYILQQVWAEAVKNDATYLIIQAGNSEYIGIRNRETQTLYLSSLMHVSGETFPPYNKVQLGLYIAAFADAVQRARKLDEALSVDDESLLPLYHKDYDFDSLKYLGCSNIPLTAQEKKKQTAEQARVDKILRYHLQHGEEIYTCIRRPLVAEGIADARLIRWQPDKASSASASNDTKEVLKLARSHLHLTPEERVALLPIGTELTSNGRVWRARLQIQGGGPFTNKWFKEVVMKFSRSSQEWELLQEEYYRYCQLSKARTPNIVQTYGVFYVDSNPATEFHVLLMSNGGIALSENNKKNYHENSNYGTTYGENILSSLRAMHAGRLLLAPALTADHILIDTGKDRDNPSVTFLGITKWKSQKSPPNEGESESAVEKVREIKRENRRLRDKDTRALEECLKPYYNLIQT